MPRTRKADPLEHWATWNELISSYVEYYKLKLGPVAGSRGSHSIPSFYINPWLIFPSRPETLLISHLNFDSRHV